jgi:hypothetical protein
MKIAPLFTLLMLTLAPLLGAPRSATVVIHSDSLQVLPSAPLFVSGIGNVYTYFSTWTDSGSFLTSNYNGLNYVSSEIRPRLGSPNIFEGAYAQATEVQYLDYGRYAVAFPTSDVDGDGVIDVLDVSKPGSFTATGSGFSSLDGTAFSIEFVVDRDANTATGSYTAKTVSASQTLTTRGDILLFRYAGSVNYDRENNSMAFDMTITEPANRRLLGSTSFVVNSNSRITYQAFDIVDQISGDRYSMRTGQLNLAPDGTFQGDLSLVDGLAVTYWADFTGYRMILGDGNDHDGDGVPDLTDVDAIPIPPSIQTQPVAPPTLSIGESVTLSVLANGTNSFQWFRNGTSIVGATTSSYTVTLAEATAGNYRVRVTNPFGSLLSDTVVIQESVPPQIVHDLRPLTVAIGQMVQLQVQATGPNLTYQWYRNGVSVGGATSDALTIDSYTSGLWGAYWVEVRNSFGVKVSNLVQIRTNTGLRSKLSNISVRGYSGTNADTLVGGFVLSDASKQLLIRSIGPTLAKFGLQGTMMDPSATLRNAAGGLLTSNNDWLDEDASTFGRLGAFTLESGSRDAAILSTLTAGVFTVSTEGANTNDVGMILLEIYDADILAPGELVNLSARVKVSKEDSLVVGMVLEGDSSATVLIRGVGPSLDQFGLQGLKDPKLVITSLSASNEVLTSNTNWLTASNSQQLSSVSATLGAFPLISQGGDSVVLVTLEPGVYTATISSASGQEAGVALAEFYLLP